jgi:UDP-hydrolysing UDP-N-acetyl-D-glucosamine 2-epimerase
LSSQRKVLIVITSRASYARIKSVLRAVREHDDLELQLVVGASALLTRYGDAVEVMRRDGFTPTACAYTIIEGENPTTMAKSTGLGILELATQFENLKPDVVLTIADRFETLATAVAASYMNIPLAHTQGGEVTGSIDESVRHAVTKLAHLHFPATALSAERLRRMGEDPTTIHTVGCPAIDLLTAIDLAPPTDLFERYGGVGDVFPLGEPYLLALQHPVTTEYGSGLDQIRETLEAVRAVDLPTIMIWPNIDAGSDEVAKGIRLYRERGLLERFHAFRNLSAEDYARVMSGAACVLGNTSSGIREGSFLGTPCVNIGTRQQGRERAPNVRDVGYDREEIGQAIRDQVSHGRYERSELYGDGRAGPRIAEHLATAEPRLQKRLAY